jgi:parallel beta-helix repeat protein
MITGNTINQNNFGVAVSGHNNIISENIVNENEYGGIRLSWGNNITIINNQINKNSKYSGGPEHYKGLILDGYFQYAFVNITIFGNVIVDSLIQCLYAKDIVIQKNTISQINYIEYETGMAIQYCENIIFTENVFKSTPFGVGYSHDVRISKNTLINSFTNLYDSYNTTIEKNILSSNTNLKLTRSSNNTITSNTIDAEQALYGIELREESNYNTITGNTITYDEKGGCVKQDDSCIGNIIENNTCTQRIIPGFDILTLLFIFCISTIGLIVIFKKKMLVKKI